MALFGKNAAPKKMTREEAEKILKPGRLSALILSLFRASNPKKLSDGALDQEIRRLDQKVLNTSKTTGYKIVAAISAVLGLAGGGAVVYGMGAASLYTLSAAAIWTAIANPFTLPIAAGLMLASAFVGTAVHQRFAESSKAAAQLRWNALLAEKKARPKLTDAELEMKITRLRKNIIMSPYASNRYAVLDYAAFVAGTAGVAKGLALTLVAPSAVCLPFIAIGLPFMWLAKDAIQMRWQVAEEKGALSFLQQEQIKRVEAAQKQKPEPQKPALPETSKQAPAEPLPQLPVPQTESQPLLSGENIMTDNNVPQPVPGPDLDVMRRTRDGMNEMARQFSDVAQRQQELIDEEEKNQKRLARDKALAQISENFQETLKDRHIVFLINRSNDMETGLQSWTAAAGYAAFNLNAAASNLDTLDIRAELWGNGAPVGLKIKDAGGFTSMLDKKFEEWREGGKTFKMEVMPGDARDFLPAVKKMMNDCTPDKQKGQQTHYVVVSMSGVNDDPAHSASVIETTLRMNPSATIDFLFVGEADGNMKEMAKAITPATAQQKPIIFTAKTKEAVAEAVTLLLKQRVNKGLEAKAEAPKPTPAQPNNP